MDKRADGYHNLRSVFYPVALKDALEIIEAPDTNDIFFTSSGILIEGNMEDNLCVKAWHLLKKDFPLSAGLKMHLHKTIPTGAGLGGGSADAAFTLQLLNKQYALALSNIQLQEYALKLGSDCPFFIVNKPCFAEGRGEILTEFNLDLSAYKILLVNPGIHINTGWAFSMLEDHRSHTSLASLPELPLQDWHMHIFNDFEAPVFKNYPEIAEIKEKLYASGALFASMSGSGSSLYGIYEKEAAVPVNFPPHYFYRWV